MTTMQTTPTGVSYRKLTPIALADDYVCPDPEERARFSGIPYRQQKRLLREAAFRRVRHDVLVDTGGFVLLQPVQHELSLPAEPVRGFCC